MDRKGSRDTYRLRRRDNRKRNRPLNRFEKEQDNTVPSAATKELKMDGIPDVSVNPTIGYKLVNFITVFLAISNFVKCKVCNEDVTFEESSCRGLGFKLVIKCSKCKPKYIDSCPLIGNAYEVNRRFIFAMRLLGVGVVGAETFCAFMDMPRPIFQSFYDKVVDSILTVSKTIAELSMKESASKEKQLTTEATGGSDIGLTVSGDGTWMKRGFNSLFGVASVIGFRTKKVLDVVVKSAYCHACKLHENDADSIEYETWKEEHANDCVANHEGSSGKMEVDAIREIFLRSQELYGVQYTHYIGDGDSKTYKAIIDSQPYGDKMIVKKECINHVQKRMGTRLRQLKKTHKGLGGKGKLTDKLIKELCNYYGKAIRDNPNSVEKMYDGIWATLHHKSSSDDAPKHLLCPEGEKSWCTWQRAKATENLEGYKHKTPLPQDVIDAVTPIYADLSGCELLQRCLGGFTQNNNESFHSLIWKFAPKVTSSRAIIVQIAAYLAVCIFNNGMSSILHIIDSLGIKIGLQMYTFCTTKDQKRMERASACVPRESIVDDQQHQSKRNQPSTSSDDNYYGPGIDDLW